MDFLTIVFILAVCALGIYVINKETKFIWKIQANRKWQEIQPDIKSINEMHEKYYVSRQTIKWYDKKFTKSTKKEFETHKNNYTAYVDFCNSKKVPIKSDYKAFAVIIEETEDVFLSSREVLDKELERAQKSYDLEYQNLSVSGEKLLETRKKSLCLISDVENLVNSIAKKPKSFDVELNTIKVKKNNFQTTLDFAEKQKINLEKGAIGIGAGVATGGAVAGIAPSVAMWVATTFGTASTGTAISALSGAAATNAALAWLGGGTLAAGGGGIVAGQALLALAGPIGWGIAGTSLLTNVILMINKSFKIQENKRDEIKRMKGFTEQLKEVELKIEKISIQTNSIYIELLNQKHDCLKYKFDDYSTFTSDDKDKLAILVNNTRSLSALLEKTIEDDN